ncbi:hypothetical protein ABID99_003682 [Mucilaginibacter sp. OAE612]|uniref:hypothetical protein n=1 Tax=Mucilaginibacter sp. OAE612 TaxID=3156444 RepID=UPI00359D3671
MKKTPLLYTTLLAALATLLFSCKTEKPSIADPPNNQSKALSGQVQITQTPLAASDFVNSVGVNVHLRFPIYKSRFDDVVYPSLKTLGIKNIRDAVPYHAFIPSADTDLIKNRFIKLYEELGIKVSYLLDSRKVVDSLNLRDDAAYLSIFKNSARLRQTIQHLEGFNEPDLTINSWYPNGWDTLTYKIQKALYTRAHAMPELAGIRIVNTSLVTYWSLPSKPNKVAAISPSISNYCDYINFHTYDSGSSNWKMFPGTYFDLTKGFFPPIQNGKPFMITEIGYENARNYNLPTSAEYNANAYHYLSELSSGKYYSVLFMEQLKRGAVKTYAYELMDQNSNDPNNSENNFGLIHTDGSVKPAFTAIKNTIDLLKDVSGSITLAPLTYTVAGDTTNLRTLLFQKNTGSYYLALWQGQPAGVNYDFKNFQDLPDDVQNISITFPHSFSVVKTYQPLSSVNAITTSTHISTLALGVPDQLLIVELQP